MFDHILVPTDLSDRARPAIEMTNRLVEGRETTITLLHVVEEIAHATRDEFRGFYEDLEQRSATKLRELASLLDCPDSQIVRQIIYGSPAVEITRFAEHNGVDLIVLASHAIDPAQPGRGWGTLSYKIGVLAPCPVLLVK